jgi:hypothetical protein
MPETQQHKPDVSALTATPEFQKLVAEAVAKTLAEMGPSPNTPGVDDATKAFFSQMAASIAEMSDQGTHRRRVPPEIMAKRKAAAEKCEKLIAHARMMIHQAREEKNEQKEKLWTPEYRVIAKIYFGERIIDPYRRGPDKTVVPQEIYWTGAPNECLRPLNKVAEDIYDAYRESIGGSEKLRSITGPHGGIVAQDGRPYSITAGGLVVKGEISPKAVINAPQDFDNSLSDNNDPNAAEVHVLGTVAAPAKRNFADPAQAMAARVTR